MTGAPGPDVPRSGVPSPDAPSPEGTRDEAREWRRIDRLFEAVLDLPEEQRSAYLAREAGDDAKLRREVERLLDADRRAGTFLGSLEDRGMGMDHGDDSGSAAAPEREALRERRIGPYRLLRVLGRGGMGTVYLGARDDDEYRRLVAIKVMREARVGEGRARQEALNRFRRERQILADLEHPAVARLYDGGTTPEGRPFLVMEHVEGVPIDVYADRERLSLDERLRLFLRVCTAVQFTHQNLLVHRDLKPNNILVRPDGEPVLLDFGIAKLLAPRSHEREGLTRTGRHLMTPSYASPEQVEGGPITTAADVYALGVLLYELLSGSSPYRNRDDSPFALIAAIREEDPPLPSAAAADAGGETLPGLDPAVVARRLSGDLDAIVMKALRKEPARRYASVAELAADLRRYLDDQPVEARRGSSTYRMGKFIRRHRVGVVAGGAVLTVLLSFLALLVAQTLELRREREEADLQRRTAEREREKAEEALGVMVDVFRQADPDEAGGENLSARALLDRGAARVLDDHTRDPQVRATLLLTVGESFLALAEHDRADAVLREALRVRRELYGPDHPAVAEVSRVQGELAHETGKYKLALRTLREAYEVQERHLGADHPAAAQTLYAWAKIAQETGDWDAAEEAARSAAAALRKAGKPRDLAVAFDAECLVADTQFRRGRVVEAEATLRAVMEAEGEGRFANPVSRAEAAGLLGLILTRAGRFEEAKVATEEALALFEERYERSHPTVVTTRLGLASIEMRLGNYEVSEALHREVLRWRRETLGDQHPRVAVVLNNLGALLSSAGRTEEALEAHREALAIRRPTLGEESRQVALSRLHIGILQSRLGWHEEALANGRAAHAIFREEKGGQPIDESHALYGLGQIHLAAGRGEEACTAFRAALSIRRSILPEGHRQIREVESYIGSCLLAQGRREEAEPWLRQSYEALLADEGEASPAVRAARERLAALDENGSGG